MFAVAAESDSSPLEMADAICQLGSAMSAIHREQLAWVARFDRAQAWREDGAADMAQWLRGQLGLRLGVTDWSTSSAGGSLGTPTAS